jgi:hypothetical protein
VGWPVYSERFIHHQAQGNWTFVVPEGMRAVVKSIDCLTQVAEGAYVNLAVGPIFATLIHCQDPNDVHHETMNVVAYQGEEIICGISATTTHTSVCGYLFADPSGATGPPARASWEALEEVSPLPARAAI